MLASANRRGRNRREDVNNEPATSRGDTKGNLAVHTISKHSPQAANLRQVQRPGNKPKTAAVTPETQDSEIGLNKDLNLKSTYVRKEKLHVDGSTEIVGEEQTQIVLAAKRFFNKARLFGAGDPKRPGSLVVMDDWIVHPASSFATSWNLLMVAFIMICMLLIPFKMAFGYETHMHGSNIQGFWAIVERIMDCYFFVDIFVNFRMAYIDDDLLVQDRRLIASRYLRGWFLIDFLSTASSVLNELAQSGGAVAMLRNLRILRLVRLMKLMKLMKLGAILEALDGVAHEMAMIVRILKIFIGTTAVTHLMACGFYVVGYDEHMKGASSWQAGYIEGFDPIDGETIEVEHYDRCQHYVLTSVF
jgi:hypothetical protein